MSALSLAIVVAPVLISGPSALEDAEMCLQPGKRLPRSMYDAAGEEYVERDGRGTLAGLLECWIGECQEACEG
jgi:hypothetical protein